MRTKDTGEKLLEQGGGEGREWSEERGGSQSAYNGFKVRLQPVFVSVQCQECSVEFPLLGFSVYALKYVTGQGAKLSRCWVGRG